MAGGTKLSCAVALLLTGCSGGDGKLTVRSLPVSPSMAARPVPARIAEARGHFALGSVALALEGFRKAQRDDPSSTDALIGIAACYDRMGRFELSRRYYESALAVAPADPTLLEAFARSLDFQGRPADAVEIREELAARSPTIAPAPAPPTPVAVAAVTTPKAAPVQLAAPAASVTVASPPPAPSLATAVPPARSTPVTQPSVASSTMNLPPAELEPAPVAAATVTVTLPPAKPKPVTRPSVASATVKLPPVKPMPAPVAAVSVTVKLPPAKPVSEPVAVAMLRQEPDAPKLAAKPLSVAKVAAREQAVASIRNGPRLERLSLAEVALVTSAPTRWQGQVVRQAAASTTVRFVPLRSASREVEVRLLNAARHQGLAARTRMALNGKGWKRVSIGDALLVRQKSLVLYSSATAAVAKRLATQFGFAIAKDARPGQLTILLGRDSIGPAQKRS